MNLQQLISLNSGIKTDFFSLLEKLIAIVDDNNQVVLWGPIASEITGYSKEEALKKDFLHNIAHIDNNLLHLIRKDGTTSTIRAYPLLDKENNRKLWIILFKFEKRPNIEWCSDAVKQANLYSSILQSMKEGVITIDNNSKITSFSRRAEIILEITAKEAIGRHCSEIIGSLLCKTDCPAKKIKEQNLKMLDKNAEITCKSGNICHVGIIATPLTNEKKEQIGTLLFIEDRTLQIKLGDNAYDFMGIIGRSLPMRRIFQVLKQVSPSEVSVLITGESGTGKEMIARAIHKLSKRKDGPFQAINCAALPLPLLESELFGHVKGAFTGATKDRAGNIETASGGTLFLDEIGEIPIETQAKLLRFLQEFEYQRIGDSKIRKADVRIVAATNRDLRFEVQEGNFREDLYYRIKVIPIEVPPLRERTEDILLLALSLLKPLAQKRGRPGLTLTPEAMDLFQKYKWPGNVRELINTLEYAIAMALGKKISVDDLPHELHETMEGYPFAKFNPQTYLPEGESEKERIERILMETNNNKGETAKLLGIHRVTLYRKLKKYNLE